MCLPFVAPISIKKTFSFYLSHLPCLLKHIIMIFKKEKVDTRAKRCGPGHLFSASATTVNNEANIFLSCQYQLLKRCWQWKYDTENPKPIIASFPDTKNCWDVNVSESFCVTDQSISLSGRGRTTVTWGSRSDVPLFSFLVAICLSRWSSDLRNRSLPYEDLLFLRIKVSPRVPTYFPIPLDTTCED